MIKEMVRWLCSGDGNGLNCWVRLDMENFRMNSVRFWEKKQIAAGSSIIFRHSCLAPKITKFVWKVPGIVVLIV